MQALKATRSTGRSDFARRIGGTPLQLVHLLVNGVRRKLYLKLEGTNPAGSVKDRTAFALIQDLESRSVLSSESIIVESTSGNLGVALAYICNATGRNFLAVVDPKSTPENLAKMKMLGAQIQIVEKPDASGGYLLGRLEYVRKLCDSSGRYVWTDQYSNPANPLAHYSCTGPEIYEQLNGDVEAVFVAVSTGGTLAGIGRYFREISPRTHLIGVDALGSVVFGGSPGPRRLTGIGSSRRSGFLTPNLYDEYMLVTDASAFACCRALADRTGISLGGSSGALLTAAAHYLAAHPETSSAVCLCADGGENYSSTIYNDQWLINEGVAVPAGSPEAFQDIWIDELATVRAQIAQTGDRNRIRR